MPSTLNWERKGHHENLYNECFKVSQEPEGTKRKNLCRWRSFLDTKMIKIMINTLNSEKNENLYNECFF